MSKPSSSINVVFITGGKRVWPEVDLGPSHHPGHKTQLMVKRSQNFNIKASRWISHFWTSLNMHVHSSQGSNCSNQSLFHSKISWLSNLTPHTPLCSSDSCYSLIIKSSFCTALKSFEIQTLLLNHLTLVQAPTVPHNLTKVSLTQTWGDSYPLEHQEPDKPQQHSTWNFTVFPFGYQSWGSQWPGWSMTWF